MMLKNLLQKIAVVLGVEFLAFFILEVILPGMISSAVNINTILLIILILITFLIFYYDWESEKANYLIDSKRNKYVFFVMIIILLSVNMIALYKVSLVMSVIYNIVIVSIVKFLWNNK